MQKYSRLPGSQGALGRAMAGILSGWWLLAAICGCSTPGYEKGRPAISHWQCDAAADEAMREGDDETGLRRHEEFVARHPDNPLARYHLGYAYSRSGNLEAEVAHYEKAIALGYRENAQLYFNLGMAYKEIDQRDQAMAAFEKSIAIDLNAVDARLELARLKQQAGDRQGARRLLLQVEELEPENEFVRQWLKALEDGPALGR